MPRVRIAGRDRASASCARRPASSAGRIELVATSHLSNSVSDELGYLFRATELTEGADDPEGLERIDGPPVRVGARPGGCSSAGEITDSLSVIALLHEAVRRLEGIGGRVK